MKSVLIFRVTQSEARVLFERGSELVNLGRKIEGFEKGASYVKMWKCEIM